MPKTPPEFAAVLSGVPDHDDRGTYVIIAACGLIAFALDGGRAQLCRATPNPDGSLTLHTVGGPQARLDLVVDAGHWYADRQAYADTATHTCRRCGRPLAEINGVWRSIDYINSGGALDLCPGPTGGQPHLPQPRHRGTATGEASA